MNLSKSSFRGHENKPSEDDTPTPSHLLSNTPVTHTFQGDLSTKKVLLPLNVGTSVVLGVREE